MAHGAPEISFPEILFGETAVRDAIERLKARGIARPVLVCGSSRRYVDLVSRHLEGLEVAIFDGARVHVPRESVDAASRVVQAHGADALISVGGGSATGLAKALRLELELPFLALPTTYSASEVTRIYGIREGNDKRTGRDEKVRPDIVAYDPALTRGMDLQLTVQSLLNAMAHPISALSAGPLEPELRSAALEAIADLFDAIEQLIIMPAHTAARTQAARAASRAGTVLDQAQLGTHHKVAHFLGGRFDLPHAPLHAALLPQFLEQMRDAAPGAFADIVDALPDSDPLGAIFDALARVGAPTSVGALGPTWSEARPALEERFDEATRRWVHAAVLGRRPSVHARREQWGDTPVVTRGSVAQAERIIVAVHGRGATADSIVQRARELTGDAPEVAIVAPQAADNAWYPGSYRLGRDEHGEALENAVQTITDVVAHVRGAARHGAKLFLFGFSQGACLTLEVFGRGLPRIAGVVALAGSRIGPQPKWSAPAAEVSGVPVLLGVARDDRWLDLADVEASAQTLASAGAQVETVLEMGDLHAMSGRQRVSARELLLGRSDRQGQFGFGGAHQTEALPGALPRSQNSPRHVPYGLYAEQINGTGFVAPRAHNERAWLYRIRPPAGQRPLEPLAHPSFCTDFVGRAPEPNLVGWHALEIPREPRDFIDGMHTLGGAGDPKLRRGMAIHVYAANRSMERRSFCNADGDLLIVPQSGALMLRTEMGILEIRPGTIGVVPRGIKFSVLLASEYARGWVGEVYGRHFELLERGPVGANGLADPRHFRAPTAWFEDRLDAGHRITHKLGGSLFEATVDHSPYDVVAWHGNYTPYAYDLSYFAPASNARVDHIDPSAYIVLTAPLDEQGSDSLDFVIFPPRWDPTEHTFRPPFFHRNAITEFNGIVSESERETPFVAGTYYLTPPMTPHGVLGRGVERAIAMSDADADQPMRLGDSSLWFQFETALPISLSRWAEDTPGRARDWSETWGHYRKYYDPGRPDFDG